MRYDYDHLYARRAALASMTVTLQDREKAGAKPPMGTGPPTHAEIVAYYLGKLTWPQIQAFINAGMLDLIHRDPILHKRLV